MAAIGTGVTSAIAPLQYATRSVKLRRHVRHNSIRVADPDVRAAHMGGDALQRIAAEFPLVPLRQQTVETRARVAGELLAGGLVYLWSGDLVTRNGDVYHRFRADSNFLYLTGVAEPGFGLLLDTESGCFTLLAPKLPPEAAVWTGGLPSLEELGAEAGADRCIYHEDLPALLSEAYPSGATVHTLEGIHQAALAKALNKAPGWVKVSTMFLDAVLRRCREHKTRAEVACLLQASRVSGEAHRAMWRTCRPGMYEYMLEATFTAAAMATGLPQPGLAACGLGYPAIVGSGPNAGVLHYERNARRCQDGDLVLVDAGAEHHGYTADITRTFPASGRFSPGPQSDVYAAVLDCQMEGLARLREGMVWKEVEQAVRSVLLQRLQEMGLVDRRASVSALLDAKIDRIFMPHGLGHHLGLDVHDCSSTGPIPEVLQAWHVVTCEPGLYVMPLLLDRAAADASQRTLLNLDSIAPFMGMGGVRIEDNVVILPRSSPKDVDGFITAAPSFNLTMACGVEKAMGAVERVMAGG